MRKVMNFPSSLNFLSLWERLHDAWLLLWPLLFLLGEEDPVLSSDRGSVGTMMMMTKMKERERVMASSSSSSCLSHRFFFSSLFKEREKTFFSS